MLNDSLGDRLEKISVRLLSVQSTNGSGPKSSSPKVLDWRREVDAAKKVAGSCKQSYECHIPTSNGETRLHPGIIAQMTVYNYWMISRYTLKNILQCNVYREIIHDRFWNTYDISTWTVWDVSWAMHQKEQLQLFDLHLLELQGHRNPSQGKVISKPHALCNIWIKIQFS